MPERISVVGSDGSFGQGIHPEALSALQSARLVVAGHRHLDRLESLGAVDRRRQRWAAIEGDIAGVLEAAAREPGPVCVVASGDPGFFGIVRPLAERFGPECLDVHPAPSSVALSFARLGLPWDDAMVVSAHGRPLRRAAMASLGHPKVAVLVSPDSPPRALGRALVGLGARHEAAVVCTRLGTEEETVTRTDLEGLAKGEWDPVSVVILLSGTGVSSRPATGWQACGWGLPESAFDHRDSMITKSEVRSIVLGKLELPTTGTMWDVGAGSGSVSVECARLAPGLRVLAVEPRAGDAERIRANADAHGATVTVVRGRAPEALADLPDPDRVFVGGGGVVALDTSLRRLAPGGRVVATYAALDRALEARRRLGSLTQVSISRAADLPDGGTRLVAENPTFVAWGPAAGEGDFVP